MCGLVGILNLGETADPVGEDEVVRMRDRIAHRGPDRAGLWIGDGGRIGLGHRRLSIIDLSPNADQPMHSRDGRHHLVYNGEVYNHVELRDAFARYAPWATDHSDTEVVLAGLALEGRAALSRFRGMFALAWWDSSRRELTLVRDRVGVKPLYYFQSPTRFFFASEIKALLTHPEVPRAIDERAFVDYLSFLTTPGDQTLFAGIRKLEPGCWLRIDAEGHVTRERYWDLGREVEPLEGVPRAELCERIRDELREAVRLRKVSDVPVGVFLSGGIDSSTNAALFSEGESTPIRTFSVGYDQEYGSYRNELHFARQMAERVGAVHVEKRLTQEELLEFLEPMVDLQDEPLADPVCFPVHAVSKLARENGVTVCQVGEGADELFWGYPYWKTALKLERANRWPLPRLVKSLGLTALSRLGKEETLYYELLRRGAHDQPVFWGGAEGVPELLKKRLLSPRLRTDFGDHTGFEALEPILRRFRAGPWGNDPLSWMSYLDLHLRLPELLLMRVDKMSMGVSLEARVPFLDHRFVELAFGIPSREKVRGGVLKGLLKEAVRGLIPDEIIDRPKQGFGVPVEEWCLDRLGPRARNEIGDFVSGTDVLDPAEVDRLFAERRFRHLWVLLNVALWWKRFIR